MKNNAINNSKHDDVFSGFASQFTVQPIDFRKIGRNYYMVSDELWELTSKIKRDIFSTGVFLGEEKHGFQPTPAMIDILSKMPDAQHKVMVNGKAEWLFLCGRNVISSSITLNPLKLESGAVLVHNERGENLGYGVFKKEGNDLVIKNILDKGKYLRYNEKGR